MNKIKTLGLATLVALASCTSKNESANDEQKYVKITKEEDKKYTERNVECTVFNDGFKNGKYFVEFNIEKDSALKGSYFVVVENWKGRPVEALDKFLKEGSKFTLPAYRFGFCESIKPAEGVGTIGSGYIDLPDRNKK